ncbi:P2X purinoceptor 7 [Exaiptasia diaphana]|uniref:P2X purinoreceptor 7 intracellular domain-containing protein n=1 Tax=Exaiptasia diaphana TaxID=2652724 RepID=A0A913XHY5_EXADI|nr:P2X purinoceptor 7 [Exaiptasia diaphana]XP_020904589.1 P2X purinoceptor 7 [Exaiptasia diaphana]KXJ11944.1 hypothetical protein AC249_AIPGENE1002 [Exaiptasia diaphana]
MSSSSRSNSSSGSDFSDFLEEIRHEGGIIQGYLFEPRRIVDDSSSESGLSSDSSNSSAHDNRLQNSDWCECEHCQVMDREVECLCCHEIPQIMEKNRQVAEEENLTEPLKCITDNPGFKAVCLNRWVLETAWFQYSQQYGAVNTPEHKRKRHIAYRQLVRWCWGVLGKEIRVVLPSCAVMCIRAHFPPPGLEDDFEFTGFQYPDE